MPHRIVGLRLGTKLHTAHGIAINGAITDAQRDDLKNAGYKLVPSQGVPPPHLTSDELEEARAADKILGITRDGSASLIEKEIDKTMADLLAPLKKMTHVKNMR